MTGRTDEHRLVTVTVEFEDGTWEIRHRQTLADVRDLVRRLTDGLDGITSVKAGPLSEPRAFFEDVTGAS